MSKEVFGFLASPVFSTRHQSQSLRMARSEMIIQRAQLCLGIVAALMVGWVPVDYLFVDLETFWLLAFGRFTLAAVFLGLVLFLSRPYNRITAYALLGFMVYIPILFSYAAVHVLTFSHDGVSQDFILSAYRNLPILAILLLAFFPLTVMEAVGMGGLAFLLVLLSGLDVSQYAFPSLYMSHVLMMFAALVIVGIVNLSQLWFMSRFVHLSSNDVLTGCLRRDYGMAMLERLFSLSKRNNMPMSLVFLDIDNFKQINDYFGHKSGDEALKTVGERLHKVLRHEDMAIRWGGEEFVLLLPNTDLDAFQTVLNRIREEGFGERPDSKPIQATMGVAEMQTDGIDSVDDFINKADARMYDGKKAGRNQIVFPGGKTEPVFA